MKLSTPNTAAMEEPRSIFAPTRKIDAWIFLALRTACRLINAGPRRSVALNQRGHLRPLIFLGATRVFFCEPLDSRCRFEGRDSVFSTALWDTLNQGSETQPRFNFDADLWSNVPDFGPRADSGRFISPAGDRNRCRSPSL